MDNDNWWLPALSSIFLTIRLWLNTDTACKDSTNLTTDDYRLVALLSPLIDFLRISNSWHHLLPATFFIWTNKTDVWSRLKVFIMKSTLHLEIKQLNTANTENSGEKHEEYKVYIDYRLRLQIILNNRDVYDYNSKLISWCNCSSVLISFVVSVI